MAGPELAGLSQEIRQGIFDIAKGHRLNDSYSSRAEAEVRKIGARHLDGVVSDVTELGDGNLNYVFRVSAGDSSVIVKQAPDYIRISGPSRPLTRDRARIEAEALVIHAALAPRRLPRLLESLPDQGILVLEDLKGYQTLRQLALEPDVASQRLDLVGEYAARVHLLSSPLYLGPIERASLLSLFANPYLCRHTLGVMFRRPFDGSLIDDGDATVARLAHELKSDVPLRARIAQLAFHFSATTEALLHGDLHTGSVMVSGEDVRVFDLEFAFMGPMSFDVGCLVAHLAFAHAYHRAMGNALGVAAIDRWANEFWRAYTITTAELWPESAGSRDVFLNGLLSDAAAYAGVEMIRRVVGGAYVPETSRLSADRRASTYECLVRNGRLLVHGTHEQDWGTIWAVATRASGREHAGSSYPDNAPSPWPAR